MKLGLFTVLYADRDIAEVVEKAVAMGIQAIELGVANYPATSHLEGLTTDRQVEKFVETLTQHHIEISALSCQGNPLHPDPAVAQRHHQGWEETVRWAERLGVNCVNVFSGCPGDQTGGTHPNWVTCAWPEEYRDLLAWQWNEKVIPYWQGATTFANHHGVDHIAFEMHPGFVVYNPYTLLKLRQAVGPSLGANVDPSHLYWQGIDPVMAIRVLCQENALFHFHAKDVLIDPYNTAVNGVLDSRSYRDIKDRAWSFCTVGSGHGAHAWAQMIYELRRGGYEGVLSIEHEDALASREEGLKHAVDLLKELVWTEPPEAAWWI